MTFWSMEGARVTGGQVCAPKTGFHYLGAEFVSFFVEKQERTAFTLRNLQGRVGHFLEYPFIAVAGLFDDVVYVTLSG